MFRLVLCLLLLALASGCSSLLSSATAHLATNFSQALLNQNDPETVRDGIPAYLLMIDGFIDADPEDTKNLLAGARLYATFAGTFVSNEERAQRLSDKSLGYARRALCIENELLCSVYDQPFSVFLTALPELDIDDIPVAYAFASAWAGWIRLHKGDWNAIADLPKITALLERVVALQDDYKEGEPHLYLAVLATQLPPSLGGKPELGRKHFERAITLSQGHNLMAKVLYARQYARLLYNRVLHDEILKEVLLAKTDYPGLTLSNTLAKRQAKELLNGADDYF
ncbi:MAG: TRAP transporter TatT component family protein [Thiohalomonadales bacterium]